MQHKTSRDKTWFVGGGGGGFMSVTSSWAVSVCTLHWFTTSMNLPEVIIIAQSQYSPWTRISHIPGLVTVNLSGTAGDGSLYTLLRLMMGADTPRVG